MSRNRIITLTSDLGHRDPYQAMIKARIIKQMPDLRIIDISHGIHKFNIQEAAFIVGTTFQDFAEGSIHLIGIKSERNASDRILLLEHKKHFFICFDNGLFSFITNDLPDNIIMIDQAKYTEKLFFMRDIFVDVAAQIVNGKSMMDIGLPLKSIKQIAGYQGSSTPNSIRGKEIFTDSFGNIVTNITKEFFYQHVPEKGWTIFLRSYEIDAISNTYNDVMYGEILALFNSAGYLEISINGGNAKEAIVPYDIIKHEEVVVVIEW